MIYLRPQKLYLLMVLHKESSLRGEGSHLESSQNRCFSYITSVFRNLQDFPGGAVVKNPPANAGNTGLIPGPGRSHMPWSN